METKINGEKHFLLPAHRNTLQKDPLGSRDHFILSSTSLLEWKLEAFIPQPLDHKVFLHEGNIALGDAPGELKIVMRTVSTKKTSLTTKPPRAYSSISRDGGHTGAPPWPNRNCTMRSRRVSSAAHLTAHTFTSTATGPLNATSHRDSHTAAGRHCTTKPNRPAAAGAREDRLPCRHRELLPHAYRGRTGRFQAVWDSGTVDTPRTHIHFGKLKISQ